MSSSASSTVSPSPPASPAIGHREPPDLSRLIQHFIAAKRALNSTEHVERVSFVVGETRHLIERTAVRSAKNTFAKGRVHEQLDILQTIHTNISSAGAIVDDEFSAVIAKLDAANDRLQATLAQLKKVVIDVSLQHSEDDEKKTLFDFVDESQYEEISTSIKTYIDTYHNSKTALQTTLAQLEDEIGQTATSLVPTARPDSPTVKLSIYDDPALPAAEAFAVMEDHAGEMATLLQSLINHYDLCITALKHTEGGREAAKTAVMAAPDDLNASNTMEESLFKTNIAEPMSEEERAEMLQVLEADVEEVEEVVLDIKERGGELEKLHEQFQRRHDTAETASTGVGRAVDMLRGIRQRLPDHQAALLSFQEIWSALSASITSQLQDIVNLQAFYEEFQAGYKKLLREVDRRKAVNTQMRRLASKAQRDLDSLYRADKLARDEFVADVASFLPSDLWPGVAEAGVRWVVETASPAADSQQPEMSQEIEELEVSG